MRLDYFFKKQPERQDFLQLESVCKKFHQHKSLILNTLSTLGLFVCLAVAVIGGVFTLKGILPPWEYAIAILGSLAAFTGSCVFLAKKPFIFLRFIPGARKNTLHYLSMWTRINTQITNRQFQLETIQDINFFTQDVSRLDLSQYDISYQVSIMESDADILKNAFIREDQTEILKYMTRIYQSFEKIETMIKIDEAAKIFDQDLAKLSREDYREYLEQEIGSLQEKLRASI